MSLHGLCILNPKQFIPGHCLISVNGGLFRQVSSDFQLLFYRQVWAFDAMLKFRSWDWSSTHTATWSPSTTNLIQTQRNIYDAIKCLFFYSLLDLNRILNLDGDFFFYWYQLSLVMTPVLLGGSTPLIYIRVSCVTRFTMRWSRELARPEWRALGGLL